MGTASLMTLRANSAAFQFLLVISSFRPVLSLSLVYVITSLSDSLRSSPPLPASAGEALAAAAACFLVAVCPPGA